MKKTTNLAYTAFLFAVLVLTGAACQGSTASTNVAATNGPVATKAPDQIAPMSQARQIADQHGGTNFKDHGTASSVGVIDSGIFYLNGKKYGVDVFDSKKDRNRWMKLTEAVFGMKPVWLTDTSVVYLVIHIPEA